ncbi:MAG: Mur ligase domain-containing protein, partial [Desulfovibrionales bacterium]
MKMRLGQAAQAIKAVGDLGGREQQWISRVQTDSRCTEPGDLFVCLPGSRFDGHNFAAAAEGRGAAAIVSQQPLLSGVKEVPVLLV